MSNDANLKTTRLWFDDIWSQGNLEIADKIISPDYDPDWVHIDKKGPDQIKHEARFFRSVFPDLQYEIVDITATENKVWVRYRATATQQKSAWGFEANQQQVTYEGATIFTFNQQGQISDRWGAFCFYDLLADLGHVPPLWELSEKLNP